MVAPRVSSDEEESDLIRLPKDTAAQEVKYRNHCTEFFSNLSTTILGVR